MTPRAPHTLLCDDRAIVLYGITCVSALAWMYLLTGAGMATNEMEMGDGQIMRMAPAWTSSYAALISLMWTIMMVAMMLPSAAPTILFATSLGDQHPNAMRGMAKATCFTAGYFMVWTSFSAAATVVQWTLDCAGLLSETMASRSAAMAAGILLVAGAYQLTPFKQACLRDCRAAFGALRVRQSAGATFASGIRVGLRCLGCCWALMGLMFVVGLMSVAGAAALSLFVLLEKTLRRSSGVTRLAGAVLIGWGFFTLATA